MVLYNLKKMWTESARRATRLQAATTLIARGYTKMECLYRISPFAPDEDGGGDAFQDHWSLGWLFCCPCAWPHAAGGGDRPLGWLFCCPCAWAHAAGGGDRPLGWLFCCPCVHAAGGGVVHDAAGGGGADDVFGKGTFGTVGLVGTAGTSAGDVQDTADDDRDDERARDGLAEAELEEDAAQARSLLEHGRHRLIEA